MKANKIALGALAMLGFYKAIEIGAQVLTWALETPWAYWTIIVGVGAVVAQAIYKMLD